MRLDGPERYRMEFDARAFQIEAASVESKMSARARASCPKLYVIAVKGRVVYVGVTNQPIRNRLRQGWRADGRTGYYGYPFRHHLKAASLFVWFHTKARGKGLMRDLETVEAEVAYLVRTGGQWPAFQTEIHFFPSKPAHRSAAKAIVQEVRRAR